MKRSIYTRAPIVLGAVLAASALLRLAGVGYGLPLFLVSDEEILIGGALRMAETRSLVPSLTPVLAETLYYPTALPYIYLALFVPLVAAQWLALGFPDLGLLGLYLVHNLDGVWIAARLVSVILGSATVWLVYDLGKRISGSQVAGIAAAALMGVEFQHVLLSSLARHWPATVFTIWLTVWFAWRIYERPTTNRYLGAAIAAGIGYGVSYVGALGLAAVALAHVLRFGTRLFNRWFAYLILVVAALVALFSLLHWPAIVRLTAGGVLPLAESKSLAGYLDAAYFFLIVVWYSSPVQLCLGGLGLLILARSRWPLAAIGALAPILYIAFVYQFMPIEDRYILPVVPVLAIAGGYAVDRLLQTGRDRQWARSLTAAVVFLVLAYPAATAVQLAHLLAKSDTRELARDWIHAHLAPSTRIAYNITGLYLVSTQKSLAERQRLDPGSLRSRDRALLQYGDSSDIRPKLGLEPAFHTMQIDQLDPELQEEEGLWRYLRENGFTHYAVQVLTEARSPPLLERARREGELVASFRSLDSEMNPINLRRTVVIQYPSYWFFTMRSFGPVVEIYRLPWSSAP